MTSHPQLRTGSGFETGRTQCSFGCRNVRLRHSLALVALILIGMNQASMVYGQTPSTGALTGVALDPSGDAVEGAIVRLFIDGSQKKSMTTNERGQFAFRLLPPGTYEIHAEKEQFGVLVVRELQVNVTETLRLDLHLEVVARLEQTQVSSSPLMVQLDTSALGRVVNEKAMGSLPLVNRNYTQIVGLSPGVTVGVFNAGELGTGATALSQLGKSNDGVYVHGTRSYDSNWQLDGLSVSDVQGSGAISGGIPVPNPDALQEFKLQTGLYDAAFGRGAGANVSVITKVGSNEYHGTLFEFLHNNILNANDFFLKQTGHGRPDLKQNQFGFTLGGPLRKDKLLAFGSYQGTRQLNGAAANQSRIACTATLNEPPLTNDRSPQALGQLFGGMSGANGGVVVNSDGSNINPVALALLNFRLPDGSFLIPTPQTVNPAKSFSAEGFAAFTQPCQFREDQGLANISYIISQTNQLTARVFVAKTSQSVTFPGGAFNPTGNIPGFNSPGGSNFFVFSVGDTYVASSVLLNEVRAGVVHTATTMGANSPFKWSDVGVSESPMNRANELPSLSILGSLNMSTPFPRTYAQTSFAVNDVVSWFRGVHTFKFGGALTRLQDDLEFEGSGSYLQFLSWPDFLLGLDGSTNGTNTFSNVFESGDLFGLVNREFRAWEAAAFVQDDYRLSRSLNLNLGVRYEHIGQFGDALGRNASFDVTKADSTPPQQGTLDGYIVASNFPGVLPAGVVRGNNTYGNYGKGQNIVEPRLGFAWKALPSTTRLVLRGGYGLYFSRPTGQASTLSVLAAPFGLNRMSIGTANINATFQAPFAQPFPTAESFPLFSPYSPSTASSVTVLAPDFRPAIVQQFGLNVQSEPFQGWLLEVGYVGTRGTSLQRFRSLNQALNASPENPVRQVTSNTLANKGLRVPIPGIGPDALRETESKGSSWYNGLEMSLTKRSSHGFQFLASYTFSKTLDTDGSDIDGVSSANARPLGDQNSDRERWGRTSFDRTHRFVLSETWDLPGPHTGIEGAMLGDWSLAAVLTVQSGTALTIADTNANNIFGISGDRAELTGTCRKGQFVTGGSIESKLNAYFNPSCFTTPPIIGADGIGTGFGNSATGIVDGPPQANVDLAVSKRFPLNWPHEKCEIQLRAEFFNALNHPQFGNPDANFTSPTFGVITSTSVNARVGQLAARLTF